MNSAPTVLVLDDEADLRTLYATALERRGMRVVAAANLAQARAALDANPTIAAVLTDMRLPDGSGMEFLLHVKRARPALPVTVITAYGGVGGEGGAVEAMRAGAFDYLAKPVDLSVLRERVTQMLASADVATNSTAKSSDETALLDDLKPTCVDITRLLPGTSPAMQAVHTQLMQWARTQAPVVLSGESGTGKELAARALHACSPRAAQPFVAVNCGAIPEQLMEAEFFGVRKGAFTGANADRMGYFQAANGGTLLLDEVADLPLAMQVKLLRALQERRVRRVGGTEEEAVDVRIVSASHKNLAALVASGQFRQDLYYRLNVMQLSLPPLRERGADVLTIASVFLQKYAHGMALTLAPDAQNWLQNYAFPGNVRELENVLERAIAACTPETTAVCAKHLHSDTTSLNALAPDVTTKNPLPTLPDTVSGALPSNLIAHLASIERGIIDQALQQTRYNRTAAAALLGLNLRQLRYRIEQLGIDC